MQIDIHCMIGSFVVFNDIRVFQIFKVLGTDLPHAEYDARRR